MNRPRRRLDWQAPRLLRWVLWLLGGISLLVLLSVVYLFILLGQSQRAMADSVREDAMWAVYQTDREAGRLKEVLDEALASRGETRADAVVGAYDLLYSRAELLTPSSFSARFGEAADLAGSAETVRGAVLDLADRVDALDDPVGREAVLGLGREVAALRLLTASLTLETNAALNAARVDHRDRVRTLQRALSVGVALLVVGFAGVVGLMAVQTRYTASVSRKLAILSERNRQVARRAQAASRAKSTFLATMSHEIRTPLNGIIGAAELLAEARLAPQDAETLSIVRESGYHLLEVITYPSPLKWSAL